MGYTLQAVIGDERDFRGHVIEGAQIVPLPQGKALMPIDEDLRERFGIPFLEFGHTADALRSVTEFVALLGKKKLAYVEAEFFGGAGGQSSAVWTEGKLVSGPLCEDDAINQALRLLGVTRGDSHDEFDALGLDKHRDTEDWKA